MQTTTSLDPALFQALVKAITPFMTSEAERRAWLLLALNNRRAYQHIRFDGPADLFTIQLVSDLWQFGEVRPGQLALVALLAVLGDHVGVNRRLPFDQLQRQVEKYARAHLPASPARWRLSGLVGLALLALIVVGAFGLAQGVWQQRTASPASTPGAMVVSLPSPTATVLPPTSAPSPTPLPTATIWITPFVPSAPPATARAQLYVEVRYKVHTSRVRNDYPAEADRFVDVLFAHLDEFQVPGLGITPTSMEQALAQPDAGDRINALVHEVWSGWLGLAYSWGFDPLMTEPVEQAHDLSPFRRLVIRMIQNRQGVLIDNQQHGLYNFLNRPEDPAIWYASIDGVIGAVNRDSFQWR